MADTTTTSVTNPARRRTARWAAGGAAGIALLVLLWQQGVPAVERHRQELAQVGWGDRLLRGSSDDGRTTPGGAAGTPDSDMGVLRGRLVGHTVDLPAAATRCVNCHAAGAAPASTSATGTLVTAAFGPPLDAAALARPHARRGGPPSRYDAASLCRLLREGIDPAWIMVDQAMPRYAISDAQCAALWARLARPGAA